MKLPCQISTSERSWMFDLNVNAPVDLAQQAIPAMREKGAGWIPNIGGSYAVYGPSSWSDYLQPSVAALQSQSLKALDGETTLGSACTTVPQADIG